MVRVVNQQLGVTADILQMYRSVDVDSLTRCLMLQYIQNMNVKNIKDIRQDMVT